MPVMSTDSSLNPQEEHKYGNILAEEPNLPPCDVCGELWSGKRCAGCQSAFYCSRKCQIKHWKKGHKHECATLQQKCIDVAQDLVKLMNQESPEATPLVSHFRQLYYMGHYNAAVQAGLYAAIQTLLRQDNNYKQ